MKRFLAVVAVLGVMLVVLAGCPAASSGGGSTTYTISGSVATPSIAAGGIPDGTYAYLKLVKRGDPYTATPLYLTTAQFSGGTAHYSISGISAGDYTGWAFIHITSGSVSQSSPLPSIGDYVTDSPLQISFPPDQPSQNPDPGSWMAFTGS